MGRSRHASCKPENVDINDPACGAMMCVEGTTGKIVNAKTCGILDTYTTKAQVIKAAIESAAMILRIDDIVSGQKGRKTGSGQQAYAKEGNPNDHLEGEGAQI